MGQEDKVLLKEKETIREIASIFQCELKENQSLNHYTTIGIGGIAPFVIFPANQENLDELFSALKGERLLWRIIGGGSNLIIGDKGIDEVIISLSKINAQPSFEGEKVWVPGGMGLRKFIQEAAHRGLGGAECLSGIPGSIGGAVRMNAGSFGASISDIVTQVELMTVDGIQEKKDSSQLNFEYRSSSIGQKEVIIGASFRLKQRDPHAIEKDLDFYNPKIK